MVKEQATNAAGGEVVAITTHLERATATVPGTTFRAEAEDVSLRKAQQLAVERIDRLIDSAIGGYAKGGALGYESNRRLKDAVNVKPPIIDF